MEDDPPTHVCIMNPLTGIIYPDSSMASYTYDAADRLTAVTDAANHVTQYVYDTENNLTSISLPAT